MQTALNENDSEAWPHIAPLLDDALAGLSAADRHAVVLRYFDGKSLAKSARRWARAKMRPRSAWPARWKSCAATSPNAA